MKVHDILIEAPVTDIETIGDIEKEFPSNLPEIRKKNIGTAKLLMQPKWLEKIKHGLRNTKWNFRVFFMSGFKTPSPILFTDRTTLLHRYRRSEKIEELTRIVNDRESDNNINIILTNNITAGETYVTMTPWIVIHRFLHVLDWDAGGGQQRSKQYITYEQTFNILDKIKRLYQERPEQLSKNRPEKWRYDGWNYTHEQMKSTFVLASKILTMGSARAGKLFPSAFELYAEIGTQVIVTGRLKFNPVPETFNNITLPKEKQAEANQWLEEKRKWIEEQFTKELNDAIGNFYLF